MPHEIFKRPQAERDIEECFVFIAEDDLDTEVYCLAPVEDLLKQLVFKSSLVMQKVAFWVKFFLFAWGCLFAWGNRSCAEYVSLQMRRKNVQPIR